MALQALALQALIASPPTGARGNIARRSGAEEHANSTGAKEVMLVQYARVDGVLRGGARQCEQQRRAKPAVRTASVEGQPSVLRPLEFTKLCSCRRMYRSSKLSKTLRIAIVNMQGMNFLSIHTRDNVAGLIEAARKGKGQLAAISDVAGGNDEHVCYHVIEEFFFVVWGRVVILMSPETPLRNECGTAATRMRVASVIGSSRLSSKQVEYATPSTPFTRRQETGNTTARSSLLI